LSLEWSGPDRARGPLTAASVRACAPDPIRAAALRALAAQPGRDRAKIAAALPLLREGTFANEALALVASLPDGGWDPKDAASVTSAALDFARATPAEQRTRADVLAWLEFAGRLAARLPDADAKARHAEIAALRGTTILVKTVPHQMLYDRRS